MSQNDNRVTKQFYISENQVVGKLWYEENPNTRNRYHALESAAVLAEMDRLVEALKSAHHMFKCIQSDVKQERGLGCDDKCSGYGHSMGCFLANNLNTDEDVESVTQAITAHKKWREKLEG